MITAFRMVHRKFPKGVQNYKCYVRHEHAQGYIGYTAEYSEQRALFLKINKNGEKLEPNPIVHWPNCL
jgi:hypothetical protein